MSEPIDGSTPPLTPSNPPPPPPTEEGAGGGTPAGAATPESPGGSSQQIDRFKARTANFGTTVNQYDGCSFGSDASRLKELSLSHFEPWDLPQLQELAADAVFDPEEIGRLEEAVGEHRVLVISGEEEVGKGTLALLLASRLGLGRDGAASSVLFASGLGTDVSVSLERLSDKAGSYAGKVVILRDAFASQNQDLLRIARELDSRQLNRLQRRLETSGTFLILTTDSARVPGPDVEPRLKSLKVLHEVSGPGTDLLLQDLRRRAERACLGWCMEGAREKVSLVLEEHGTRVVGELRSVPRIDRFVRYYLLEVVEEKLRLDEAVARARNRESWLLSELSEDLEAWAFTLALILAQPLPCPEGVPWYPFYRLWRELSGQLRRELRMPREARATHDLVLGPGLLDRVRAQVRRSPYPVADTVQFQASIDPARLWEALLGPGRSLVTSLVPLLQRLAEDGEFALREAAARSLGRIGKLDPANITFPLIYGWADQDVPLRHHVALGRLLQGVFGQEDAAYREASLRQLRRVALCRTGKGAWPGAVALREIGRLDLELAVGELVEMVGRALEERLGEVSQEDREALRVYEAARRLLTDHSLLTKDEAERVRDAVSLATPMMFGEDEQHVLAAVEYSLVGLCFARSPIRVLDELRRRLQERSEGKLAPLVTLLFLRDDGIAERLDRIKTSIPVAEESDGPAAVTVLMNDLLISATYEEGALEILRGVLEAVFRGTEAFPGLLARAFKARLMIVLKSLAKDACRHPRTREVCAGLFAELLASEDRSLKEQVFRMLQKDPDFTEEGSDLAEFALDALVRRPSARRLPAA